MLTGSVGGGVVVALLGGGLRRRSASRASSAARRRARSDRSPSANACMRQARRLMSQVRLLAWVVSPKSSAKRCRSWPTLRRSSDATSWTMFSCTGFSFLGLSRWSTRVDSEPRFGEKRKAIRDKKERLFERKGRPEEDALVVKSTASADQEWSGIGGRVTSGRVKPRIETLASGSLAQDLSI